MLPRPSAVATIVTKSFVRGPPLLTFSPPALAVFAFGWAQLLKLAAHADFSEEAGRRRLVTLLQNLLVV